MSHVIRKPVFPDVQSGKTQTAGSATEDSQTESLEI